MNEAIINRGDEFMSETDKPQQTIMHIPDHIREVYRTATCLYRREEVDAALDRMAFDIHNKLEFENPLFLTVMVGGMIPAGHLLTRIDFPLEMDYVHATRYCGETSGSALVWKNRPSTSLKDRTIVVVDDILDGGITLKEIVKYCEAEGAKKVYTAVLVEKRNVRLENGLESADFTGLEVDDYYVFGYGMDYKEYLRNAPGIYAISKEYLT
jgi:hypoxanthine phosphoribosyltransferase